MAKQEIKNKLHELIDTIEDEHVLRMLGEFVIPYVIHLWSRKPGDDNLTGEQGVQLDDIITGFGRIEIVSYEEFTQNIDDWLTRLDTPGRNN